MLRSTLLAVLSVFCLVAVPLAACAQEVTNLVLNPSFEEDEIILDDPGWGNWYTWGWEKGLESTIEFDENEFIDGTRSLRIEPKGDIDWHFILANDGNVVKAGKTFTASFWAKAEEERPIAAQMKATDNTASFCYTELGFITTEWQEFTFSCEPLNDEIKLEIFCAASDVAFWLDFVYIYQDDYVEGILPSELAEDQLVLPVGKLPARWADIKSSVRPR